MIRKIIIVCVSNWTLSMVNYSGKENMEAIATNLLIFKDDDFHQNSQILMNLDP